MQRLRDLELLDRPRQPIRGAFRCEQAAVEQHAHGLDRVQRDTLGTLEDAVAQLARQPGHEPGKELLHRLARERLEVHRGEAALPGTPGRPALEQLRPGQRDHEQRVAPRPVEEMLDEVQQARVRPLHVLEGEHGRIGLGQSLEEKAPGGEQVLLVPRLMLGQPEQVRQPRLQEAALLGVEDVLFERRAELAEGGVRLLVLRDAAAHPHHVRQRPVGDPFAIRKAATAVPVHGVGDPVEVLVELPGKARLADPGDAGHRDEMRLVLLCTRMEEILDLAQLTVTADEGSFEAVRLERPAQARDDAQRPPQRRRTFLALQLERAGVVVDDRLLGRASRRIAGVDLAGLGHRLDARGGVDQIAGDHALALRSQRDRRLAGEHPGPGA